MIPKTKWHSTALRSTMRLTALGVIGCAALISFGFALGAAREPIMLSDAAQKAIEAAFPNAPVQSIERERLVVDAFDVELTVDGKKIDALVTVDGTILEIERRIDPANLPAAVRDSLTKIAAGTELQETEEIQLRGELKAMPIDKPRTVYEAEVSVNGKDRTIVVDANGKQTRGIEGDDDDDDEDDDDNK